MKLTLSFNFGGKPAIVVLLLVSKKRRIGIVDNTTICLLLSILLQLENLLHFLTVGSVIAMFLAAYGNISRCNSVLLRRPQGGGDQEGIKCGDVFNVSVELASKPVARRDAAAMQDATDRLREDKAVTREDAERVVAAVARKSGIAAAATLNQLVL
ncbi:hypothetical protein ACH5RR_010651 [Cinchona calisaya]|uniref:SMP domain-containing protein n=1 Tax=Cinchona calisaya TaxID=153742 RepID=A0ABD3AJJ3_9GENT